ncbi:MAG: tRNA-binding protein [Candidatus Marsarchaeota archaeon]|nr:tRNA-binding protein [Candidatus Marsarchaeota archaeon]
MEAINYDDFRKVDARVGMTISVDDFPEARKPAYKLKIDFGNEIGTKSSSAQITTLYRKEELIGRLVVAVVNFSLKLVAGFRSEVLVLGTSDKSGNVVLLSPGEDAEIGVRAF